MLRACALENPAFKKLLDIWLDRPILAIAQYGMWGRTKTGVCEIGSNSIKDCLYSNDDKVTWFLDSQGDLRCDGEHEVGTNHYLYRTWKDDVTPRQKQMMMQRVIEGKPVERDIANHKVICAGCCISNDDPEYHCNDCGEDFGHRD